MLWLDKKHLISSLSLPRHSCLSPSVSLLFVAGARVVPVAVITSVLVKLALIVMMLHLWWIDAHSQCGCDAWSLGVCHPTLHKSAKVRNVDVTTNDVKDKKIE